MPQIALGSAGRYQTAARIASARISTISSPQNGKCRPQAAPLFQICADSPPSRGRVGVMACRDGALRRLAGVRRDCRALGRVQTQMPRFPKRLLAAADVS
jgi:hypothetical protein